MLDESGQDLLSLGYAPIQGGASSPIAWSPPRARLRQLSPQALQHEGFLVAVGSGPVDGSPCHRQLKWQWTFSLRLRLVHPRDQVVDAGGARLLGQLGRGAVGRAQQGPSLVARPPVSAFIGPFCVHHPCPVLKVHSLSIWGGIH
jgi:hypothetical protein